MATVAPLTVLDRKLAFLQAQIRSLGAPLRPLDGVEAGGEEDNEGRVVGEEVLDEVFVKLDTLARRHHGAVFSQQAVRHVAEQIDALYWDSTSGERPGGVEAGEEVFEKGVDLRRDGNIEMLPDMWDEDEEEPGEEENEGRDREGEERYAALVQRLRDLSARRQIARQRLAHHRHLQTLVEPLRDARENLQPNLVTRDGELGGELDLMRILIARVRGKLEGKRRGEELVEREAEGELGSREKVRRIVEGL